MSIKRTIIAAVVGLTLVAMVAPGVAQGVTIDELLAQIAVLQAQLLALQGGSGGTPVPTGIVACSGVTFTRSLVIGSTGQDVKCAQVLLNNNGYTLAQSGAGSPGMETSYFGPITLAAVRTFQMAKGWTPANQVGPLTRAALNALISSTPGTPGTPGTPIPAGAGLTVALASTNPAAGTIVDGQAQFPLARLIFTNGDNAEVTVTGLKAQRIGVSADASVANVYLFNGATRLTDGASVSSTMITFNDSTGLFKVPAYGTVTITVTADVDGTAGETMGVQVVSASDITTNASSINGTFPVKGNLHTIATGSLASFSFSDTTTPAEASVDPQDDYAVFQNSVTVGTRAVDLQRISFRKTGSVDNDDLQNFELYVDGVKVGSTMQLDSDGYVTFDLTSSPKRLEAGTRVVKVLADIINGSSLTFTMHVWNTADVTVVDSQYNANILVQKASATFAKESTGEQTINTGTLTITKMADSPSGDIVDGASNALLAKFQIKAAGEAVKVETLKVSVVVDDVDVGYLRNGALYANGVQVGSTSNLYDSSKSSPYYTSFSLGSSLIVQPGSPVTLEVKADIYDNDGTDDVSTSDTIVVRIEGSSSENNAIGQSSASTIDAPSADVDGNTLTVATGGLTLSQYAAYTAQTVVAPLTAHKIAHFTLTASTTEDVNVSTINVALNAVASSYGSNLYVVYGANTTNTKPTVAATNAWAINYTLPAGDTIDIMVYQDMNSSSSGTAVATVDIDGTTANSAASADSSAVDGQNILFGSGDFETTSSGSPLDQMVAGNQTVDVASYVMTASYQQYTVTEMRFSMASDTIAQAVVSASLKDSSGAVLKTVPYDTANDRFYFTGLNIVVPASTSKTITLAYALSPGISSTADSSNVDVKPTLTHVKRQDPNGSVTTDTSFTTAAAETTLVYMSVPILTLNDLNNSNYMSNGGEQSLYSFKVKADKGDTSMKQFKLAVTWSDGGTDGALELGNLKLLKNGLDITSSVSILNEDGNSAETSGGDVSEDDGTIVVVWDGNTADTIASGSEVTYTIKGTPAAFRSGTGAADVAGVDSVSLVFDRDTAAQTAGHVYLNANASAGIIGLHDSAASATGDAEEANMIWSDMSAVGHAPSDGTVGASSKDDWTNSYLAESILNAEVWVR